MSQGGGNLGGAVFTLKVDEDPLVAGLKKAEAAAKHASNAIGNDLAHGTKTATQGMLQLGYAIDDLQYGFSAIANNIPQIAMGFGAGAGLAGGIAIASTAVNQLIKHWGELSDIAQSAWSGSSVEQLHNIRKAAEEAAKAFDKLTKQHTKQEEATTKFTTEAIVEGGIGKVLSGLAGGIAMDPGMRAQLTEQENKDRQDKIAMANRLANPEDRISQLAAIEKNYGGKLDAANRAKAVQMITQLDEAGPVGDLARRNAHRFATANPGAFPEGFAAKMNPEAAEKDRIDKENIKANIQGNKNIRAAEKKADEERLQANKHLNEEGIRFEKQMKHDQLEAEKRDLQEQIKKGEHVLTHEGKKQLQDKLLGGKAPEESKIMSVKAFADKMLTAGMNTVPQKQLDTLVQMHTTLKDIDKKLRDQGLQ